MLIIFAEKYLSFITNDDKGKPASYKSKIKPFSHHSFSYIAGKADFRHKINAFILNFINYEVYVYRFNLYKRNRQIIHPVFHKNG